MLSNIKDMTEGKPFGLMIRFAAPLMLINVLQMTYTMVDSAVVGRVLGVDAFAAVGATGSTFWVVMCVILGIMQGFGATFAQRFGARDFNGLRKSFAAGLLLSVMIGTIFSAAGITCGRFALAALNTPPELMKDSTLYLGYLLGGMLITLVYNTLGAMLRALGDSKTPLYAMIISTLFNTVMDIALVFPLGIAGVAIATLLAQAVASTYCALKLRGVPEVRFSRRDFSISSAKSLLWISMPLGLRNAVIQLGGLAVQRYVNGFGPIFVAGVAAGRSMYSPLLMANDAVEGAVATFVAQNIGAGRVGRVRQGVANGFWMMLSSSIVFATIALVFGRFLMSLLIADEQARLDAVLDVGQQQLNMLALGMPVLGLLLLFRASLQGMGNTLIPMLSGFLELTGRFIVVLALTSLWGVWGVYAADPAGWVLATFLLGISYFVVYKRLRLSTGNEKT